ncbi:tRNA pseudouridine32 synthase / 23S rRNA pseudouridine746 synthase [Filimonas lacunae]|uniref:tRNA pseudouridine32 synthase / 23S rRNA pseudouridine746 synthase n=1 Tax=Filimonas lacunae TaxID=477680 RepID=A0A173M948_9BACT|nr:RluA family pseudouridine synthase [Filimonas lacunae]BAV04064.1 ribosomal large subunit pseudouridine synthase A [Filimonas lacunae]SIT15820.1 tRNA pseudouridine32 synthase / 23S rRNA pseudouridine746 synthase [Filimonas lacunae]
MGADSQSRISYFPEEVIKDIALPERFTFPFYYEPHPLTKIAAAELQHYLDTQANLEHNFGLSADKEGMVIGKMFGVLVVQDAVGKLGYLSAFSGKLAGTNDHPKFVPPVFDMLVEDSFFLKEQEIINTINARIEAINTDESYLRLKQDVQQLSAQSLQEIAACKQLLKINKDNRSQLREQQKEKLAQQEYVLLEEELIKQSLYDKRQLKELTVKWEQLLEQIRTRITQYEKDIEQLKNERKERSASLQQQLFQQYVFLNKAGKHKSLQDIFSKTAFGKPPAGAGECATPKLLQFAFAHGYKPLAMAEFWWGASPKSEIRVHQHFYPACTGKCKPILAHMLEGMEVEENPFLRATDDSVQLAIVYEDDSFVVVNKPHGLRSVPGVDIHDSVYTRLQQVLGNIEPLIVHRLDMDTSGLLVVAKTPEAHKHIQKQFLQRTVSKRYRALLSKVLEPSEGEINLPLAADFFNRPRQLVCFTTGKRSVTRWKVVARYEATTKVDFWPLTGRTHQLRMHSAHELGLNAPIVGDDLYGTSAERMYLHAAYLEFIHPQTRQKVSFEVAEGF